jgi:hypothetical protein
MKLSVAAVFAAAAAAQAWKTNVTYTTEVVTALTTYCPFATTLTHGGHTYTVTEATTLTITNCPCTVTKPVITSSSVVCNNCGSYSNATTTCTTATGTGSPAPTTSAQSLPTAGAGKVAALSGAGLAGVLGLAAFVL